MWEEKVLNPQLIKSIFKDEGVPLERIKMRNVQLVMGSDLICIIDFDLKDFLQSPPVKWVTKGYNTVLVCLSFIQATIKAVEMSGSDSVGALTVAGTDKGFEINYSNPKNGDRIVGHCSWIHVDKIEGYKKEV